MPSTDAPEAVYKLIGERLAKLREERATTQEDLGMFAGLTRASIANIEKGRQRVFLHQLYRFADYLGVKLTDLLPDPEKVRFARVVPEAEAAYLDKLRKHVFISTGGRHRQNRRRV